MEVKTSDQITEEPWAFLEKELEQFQRVIKDLEDGPRLGNFFVSCEIIATKILLNRKQ